MKNCCERDQKSVGVVEGSWREEQRCLIDSCSTRNTDRYSGDYLPLKPGFERGEGCNRDFGGSLMRCVTFSEDSRVRGLEKQTLSPPPPPSALKALP